MTETQFPVPRSCPFAEPAEYQKLRETAPVSKVPLVDGTEAWWVSGWAVARAVLTDPRFSSDRNHENFPLLVADADAREQMRRQPWSLVGMDGEEHAAARQAVLGEFTVRRMAAFRPRIQQIVDRFVDEMLAAPTRPVDLVTSFSLTVPSLVICELLGVPFEDHDFFQQRTTDLLRRTTPPAERGRLLMELRSYLGEVVLRKQREPGDDLLSRQIARGHFDRAGLVELAFLLLAAGHDTTANMISLGVLGLLQHPEQLARLTADPAKTPGAVEELMRYFTIADSSTVRVSVADVQIGDVHIPADEGVFVSSQAANWDPAAFDHPDVLDVERGARNHVAFGFGPHQCLGQNLARLELQIVFDTLFQRIPGLRLAAPIDEIPFKTDGQVYGVYELPVTW